MTTAATDARSARGASLEDSFAPSRRLAASRRPRWLDVSAQLLRLAADDHAPLLERVRLLAIFSSLLDAFFAKTASALTRQMTNGSSSRNAAGQSAAEQLRAISLVVHDLVAEYDALLHDDIRPELARGGTTIVQWDDTTALERDELRTMFRCSIDPVLTPLTVDATHPFPYVSSLSLNLAVLLRDRESGRERCAHITVPPLVPPLVRLDGQRLLPVDEVIAAHLPRLFAGSQVVATHCFRVTRSRAIERPQNTAEPSTALTRELRPRRFGTPVRLEVERAMTPRVLAMLVRELGVSDAEVYRLRSSLSMSAGLWAMGHAVDAAASRGLDTAGDQPWVFSLSNVSSAGTTTASSAAIRSGRADHARLRSVPATRRARATS